MTTITDDVRAQIRAAFLSPDLTIGSGVGSASTPGQGSACTIAEIKLILTGHLDDGPHPCISEVIRRWVIRVQDSMPAELRNAPEWREAAIGIAGSASTLEVEEIRRAMILDWMWGVLGDEVVLNVVPTSCREAWGHMLTARSRESATEARSVLRAAAAADADADAYAAAAAAAYAAAAADAYAPAAAAYTPADAAADAAAYAAAAAYTPADAYAAADTRRGVWVRSNPAATLARLVAVTA